jgi:transcriptional antiterminator RfaH
LPGPWWVAHTKARHEKSFAWDLHKAGIGYFLPLVERVTVSGGRKRQVLKPLFSAYVFFCGDEQTRYHAMTTNRLCNVLAAQDQALLVTELDQLHQAIQQQAALEPDATFEAGQRVRVTAGPLQGIEGAVVEDAGEARQAKRRLVLQVSMLGQGASVEIERELIEPLDITTAPAGGIA